MEEVNGSTPLCSTNQLYFKNIYLTGLDDTCHLSPKVNTISTKIMIEIYEGIFMDAIEFAILAEYLEA